MYVTYMRLHIRHIYDPISAGWCTPGSLRIPYASRRLQLLLNLVYTGLPNVRDNVGIPVITDYY